MKKQGSLTKKILLALSAGMFSLLPAALALPTGGVSDTASIAANGTTMDITGSAANNVINWQTFSIASGETVNFTNTNNYLNLVTGSEMSRIYGSLTGGGTIALINPNGIIFGAGANVNVGSLIASTQPITNTIGTTFADSGVVETAASAAGNVTNVADLSAVTATLIGNNVVISSAASLKDGSVIKAAGDVGVGYAASDTAATEVNTTEYATGYTGTAPTALTGVTVTKLDGTTSKAISGYMQVRNVYELQNMKNNLTGKYLLTGDIDASVTGTSTWTHTWTNGTGFEPITNFTGKFNGMGHSIDGLHITRTAGEFTAPFGEVTGTALISNVTVANGAITGTKETGAIVGESDAATVVLENVHNVNTTVTGTNNVYTGGIIGCDWGGGIVRQSSNSGTVSSKSTTVGGIAGVTRGSISSSSNSGQVTGPGQVGGIAGYSTGTISYVHNEGEINSTTASTANNDGSKNENGGIVGWMNSGAISHAYNTGNITAAGNCVGGLVGHLVAGNITDTYNTGAVVGHGDNAGGLVGYAPGSGTLSNSYNTGNVTLDYAYGLAGDYGGAGGIIGQLGGAYAVKDVYNTGTVTAVHTGSYAGGIAGRDSSSGGITDAYNTGTIISQGEKSEKTGGDMAGTVAWGSGGIVGYKNSNDNLTRVYNVGAVSVAATGGVESNRGTTGGILAVGTLTNGAGQLYANTTAGGNAITYTNTAGIAVPYSNLLQARTFTDNGWTTTDLATVGGIDAVWRIYEGYTTPLLKCFLKTTTATGTPNSFTYDGTVHRPASVSYTALADNHLVTQTTDLVVNKAHATETKTGETNAGTYTYRIYSDQQHYDIIDPTYTIAKAPLTITGKDVSVYTGTTEDSTQYGYTTTGLVTGEEGLLKGTTVTPAAGAYTDGVAVKGTYDLTLVNVPSLANYTVTLVPGTLTVTDKPVPTPTPTPTPTPIVTPTEQKTVTDIVGSVVHQHDGVESHDKQGSTLVPSVTVLQPTVTELPKSSSSSASGDKAEGSTLVLQNAVTGTMTTLGTLALSDMRVLYKVYDGGSAVPDTAVAAGGQEDYAVADFDAGVENRHLEK